MNAILMKRAHAAPPILPAAAAALLLSLLLFGAMHAVIHTGRHALEKREALPEMVQQILNAERKILDAAREPGFTAAQLLNRFFY